MLCIAHIEYKLALHTVQYRSVWSANSAVLTTSGWVECSDPSVTTDRVGGRGVAGSAQTLLRGSAEIKISTSTHSTSTRRQISKISLWGVVGSAQILLWGSHQAHRVQVHYRNVSHGKYFGLHKISANILDSTKSVQIFWIAQHFIIIFGSRGSSERKTRNFLFGVSKSFTKKEFCNFVQVLVQVQVQVLECGELEISSGYLTCCPFVSQLLPLCIAIGISLQRRQ